MNNLDNILSMPAFSVGDSQVTIGALLAAIIVILLTSITAAISRNSLHRFFLRLHEGDNKFGRALGIVAQIVVWLVGIEVALHLLGIHLSSLFAAGGFLALGAGFAVKNVVENFISGGMLKAEHSVRPGDLISMNDKWVYIERIGLRTIAAKTYKGEDIIIPNSMLAQSLIINLTRDDRLHRIEIPVRVGFDADQKRVREVLEKTLDKLPWRSKAHKPEVYMEEFGDSGITYSVEVLIDDASESFTRKSNLYEAIWWAFDEAEIPLAGRKLDVRVDNRARQSSQTTDRTNT